MATLQKKEFSRESQRSSWASKSFSMYFWLMLWILFRFSNIRPIEWWQFHDHDRHQLDFMRGNWPSSRFLQIEAWNACRIFYSLGLTRPLQVSKKFFWDIFLKIRFHSFVELDLENRLSTHNMVLSLELKTKKIFDEKFKKPHLSALLK